MPGVLDRLATAETAAVVADDCAILADHDVIGISLDLEGPADGTRGDRVLVVVEANQAGLRHRGLRRVEPVEWPGNLHKLRPLRLESLPDRAVGQFRMAVCLGVGNALVEQPGVQFVKVLEPMTTINMTVYKVSGR